MVKLTNDELKQVESDLKEAKLIETSEVLDVTLQGDYWEKFLIFNNQVRGYYYFTNKSIVFLGGALASTRWSIKYENIKSIKKCNIALFMPTGIKLEVYDEEKAKLKTYKLSVLKREYWIEYISSKIN